MRLLVVEDDRQLRDQLAQGLIDSGFVVDVAGDGREVSRSRTHRAG